MTVRTARDQVCNQAAITTRVLARARREAIIDLPHDLLPKRRTRQFQRVKRPPKNTFPTKKRDPPGRPAD